MVDRPSATCSIDPSSMCYNFGCTPAAAIAELFWKMCLDSERWVLLSGQAQHCSDLPAAVRNPVEADCSGLSMKLWSPEVHNKLHVESVADTPQHHKDMRTREQMDVPQFAVKFPASLTGNVQSLGPRDGLPLHQEESSLLLQWSQQNPAAAKQPASSSGIRHVRTLCPELGGTMARESDAFPEGINMLQRQKAWYCRELPLKETNKLIWGVSMSVAVQSLALWNKQLLWSCCLCCRSSKMPLYDNLEL